MEKKPALGRGLGSLFPNAVPSPALPYRQPGVTAAGPATPVLPQHEVSSRDRHPGISIAQIDEIRANQYQPRRGFDDSTLQELADSIRSSGLIQPLVVRKTEDGHYELIAGERRLRASKLAGLKQVPIVIRRSTDRESLELALIENIQRENLNCIDEAMAYLQLVQDFSLTQEEVATRVGKDRATVANFLRLLRLPIPVIDDLKAGILSFGHGKAILSLEEPEQRLRARAEIIEKRLSVRAAEILVEEMKIEASKPKETTVTTAQPVEMTPVRARLATVSQDLTRHWSVRVEVKGTERRGKIVFSYTSRAELDRLLEAMQNQRV